ncbi:hypothetical protein MN032_12025 [Agromyces atrinae]|uniref:hypothetical protein n=1 Tax=Agromyces atrinae TaxID=592376 RepID=UPI001F56C815|nr:hypothetical protein [Agromyces atrinae]MCI2958421.1 hypothetical protein [Agromyces atrinae]
MTLYPLEAGLTAALWDLFSADGPSEIAIDALERQLDGDDLRVRNFLSSVREHGSRAWLPRRSPGADLAVIGPDDEFGVASILAVIEIKAAAKANYPLLSTAESLDELEGSSVASSIVASQSESRADPGANLSQLDLYRSRKWWKDSDGVRLDRPDSALWLVFDSRGRTIDKAFRGTVQANAWTAVNLHQYADDLRGLRERAKLSRNHDDAIAVVLWHIDQAPGGNRTPEGQILH